MARKKKSDKRTDVNQVAVAPKDKLVFLQVDSDVDAQASELAISDVDGNAREIYDDESLLTGFAALGKGSYLVLEGSGGVLQINESNGKRLVNLDARLHGVHPIGGGRYAVFGSDGKVFVGTPTNKHDPSAWRPSKGLRHDVLGMAGDIETGLWACGERGMLARFDGSTWKPITTDVKTALNAVLVVSPDRVLVCGNGGVVGEWSNGTWSSRVAAGVDLLCLATFKKKIYVGAGEEGLLRLEDGKCKVVKDNVTSYCFDVVGDRFAIGGGNEVGFFDGKSFDYVELEPIYED